MITVREDYRSYSAPAWVQPTIERLLRSVPESHLIGLSAVILTEAAQPSRSRRARRNRRGDALARYHRNWQGDPAWIELVVDEIVKELPRPLDRLQLARDLVFGRVLFHEIGHHLHLTSRGIGRSDELSAKAWQERLSRMHVERRYSYLRPLMRLFRLLRN